MWRSTKLPLSLARLAAGNQPFLRSINRMNELADICRVESEIEIEGKNIYDKDVDVVALHTHVGMVFQKTDVEEIVEKSLHRAELWNEVADRLLETRTGLWGGQQQRLCIARAIATQPKIIFLAG